MPLLEKHRYWKDDSSADSNLRRWRDFPGSNLDPESCSRNFFVFFPSGKFCDNVLKSDMKISSNIVYSLSFMVILPLDAV
jgi:hypothetical protein